jgi:hypothetical protein
MINWVVIKKNNSYIQKKDKNKDLSGDNLIEVCNINQAIRVPMTRQEIEQWIVNGYTPELVQGHIIHS